MRISDNLIIYYQDEITYEDLIASIRLNSSEVTKGNEPGFAHTLYKYKRYSEAYKSVVETQPMARIPETFVIIDMTDCKTFNGNEMNKVDAIRDIKNYATNGGVTYVLYCRRDFPKVWE